MIIDPVYEGKSMAGLIDLVRAGEIAADSTVLYAHLGGQPALNAYSGGLRVNTGVDDRHRDLRRTDVRPAARPADPLPSSTMSEIAPAGRA